MRVNTFILLLLFFVCLLEANAQQWNSETDIKNHYSNEIRSLQQEIEEAKRNKEYALNLPEKEPDGRTNLKRVNMLVESNVIISVNQQRIKELENQCSSQLDIFRQQQQQKQAQEAALRKQAAKAKAAAEKAKNNDAIRERNDAIRAQNEIIEASNAAIRAEEEAKKEAERIAEANERKALGDAAAAEAAIEGQIRSQNRMNNLMDGHEEHQYNIERTNPNDMNLVQRQRIGGDYSRARMSSHNSQKSFDSKQSQMSNMLGNVKSKSTKQSNSKNLDELENQLKELSDFLDQR